jgi:hypothetical protein
MVAHLNFSVLMVAASFAEAGLVVMIFVATLYLQELSRFLDSSQD